MHSLPILRLFAQSICTSFRLNPEIHGNGSDLISVSSRHTRTPASHANAMALEVMLLPKVESLADAELGYVVLRSPLSHIPIAAMTRIKVRL